MTAAVYMAIAECLFAFLYLLLEFSFENNTLAYHQF